MEVGFDNILNHVIPMGDFSMKWRFTDANYDLLPAIHLEQLKPLDSKASKFLWDFIIDSKLHNDTPFKKDFFRNIDKAKILTDNRQEIKKWLYQRGIAFDKDVYLSWQPDTAMIVPWKVLIKYFYDFYYADDLTVIDQSLNWALLFYHEDEIYFGTNKAFRPSASFDDIDFLW